MIWKLKTLTMQRQHGETVLEVGLLCQDVSRLIEKKWFIDAEVDLPMEWTEGTGFKRVSGPRCTVRRLKEFYEKFLRESFMTTGTALVMQMGRGHAILMQLWTEDFGYKFTHILGSMAKKPPISDYGDNGGSDDEQIIMIEVI